MRENTQQKIVELCTSMIDGKTDLIEGCRSLVSLRNKTDDAEDEVFFPIRAIDSETDHFPVGSIRENCSEDFLARSDRELSEYLLEAQSDIILACKDIIKFFEAKV